MLAAHRPLLPFVLLLATCAMQAQTSTESVVYTFCEDCSACPPDQSCTDGAAPMGNLVQGPDGYLYGATFGGGAAGGGTIFTTAGVYDDQLYSFSLGSSGFNPFAGLILASDGNFYGTTEADGNYNSLGEDCTNNPGYCGSVFRITPSGQFTVLHDFGATEGSTDGYGPEAGLIQGSDGNLYGASQIIVSPFGYYTNIFKISLDGTFSNFAQIDAGLDYSSGYGSMSLLQASDGNFYIPASYGTSPNGAIYKITPTGAVSILYTFTGGSNGVGPAGSLIEGSDGGLYGVTDTGGTADTGTVFKVTLDGQQTVLSSFCDNTQSSCNEGYDPTGLLLASDGNFYGTTIGGGLDSDCYDGSSGLDNGGCGGVFEVTPVGTLTSLYNFTGTGDGSIPSSGLIQGQNGNFYGVTSGISSSPATYEYGNVYEIVPASPMAAPVQISLSKTSITLGSPVTATLAVSNAFSTTMQQCYGFSTLNGTTTALGKLPGKLAKGIYGASIPFTPTVAGNYSFAVTCGGTESGFATLKVTANSTKTTLTASPNPVTPPASVTLTATVTRTTGSGTPTGTVKFTVATTVLGSAKLNSSGIATLAASSSGITAGTYPVVAAYSGDSEDVGSASTAVDVTVK
jgi:uncharacterized repeat protein (TIGR03803 family)